LEYWNNGYPTLHHLENSVIHGINSAMDRKNINRGFKKLRVWTPSHRGILDYAPEGRA